MIEAVGAAFTSAVDRRTSFDVRDFERFVVFLRT